MKPWFRWYRGSVTDVKFRSVALDASAAVWPTWNHDSDDQPITVCSVISVWAVLLERADDNGGVTMNNVTCNERYVERVTRYVSAAIELSEKTVSAIINALLDYGLLDSDAGQYRVRKWVERQSFDTTAAERMQRYRKKKVASKSVTPPLRDTDTDTDTKKNIESRAKALPLGWKPSDPVHSHEKSEFDKFTDHFRANGKRMKDWEAAWRNWKRRAAEFSARGSPRGPMPSRTQVAIGKLMEGYADGMESRQGNGTNCGGQTTSQLPAASPGSRDLRGATNRPLCGETRSVGDDDANTGGNFRRMQISAIGCGSEGVADEADGTNDISRTKRSA